MKRRDFLKKTLEGGALAITAKQLTSCVSTGPDLQKVEESEFKKQFVDLNTPNSLEKLPVSKRVLIVGSGVAGMTAALFLAEKGYKVTIREASALIGGKLQTKEENLEVGKFQIPVGLQCWDRSYFNFNALMQKLGVFEKNFETLHGKYVVYPTGRDEWFLRRGDYPKNLANLIKKSSNIDHLDVQRSLNSLHDIFFFDHTLNLESLDDISFNSWLDSTSIDPEFVRVLLKPLTQNPLYSSKELSAAAGIVGIHTQVTGNPFVPMTNIANKNHNAAFIEPWRNKLESLGVKIRLNSPVMGLQFNAGACVGASDYPKRYDHTIMATDIPGLKKILKGSKTRGYQTQLMWAGIQKHLTRLKTASNYRIIRVWLDKPIASQLLPRHTIINTGDHPYIDRIINCDMIEPKSRAWAKENNGSIIEVQMRDSPTFLGHSPAIVWNKIKKDVARCFKNTDSSRLVAKAKPLDFSMGSFDNLTSFAVGQNKIKPTPDYVIKAGIKNLYFAGDWVRIEEFPSNLLETSIASAKLAVNALLKTDGIEQIPIWGLSPNGVGNITKT